MLKFKPWSITGEGKLVGDLYDDKDNSYGLFVINHPDIKKQENGEQIVVDTDKNKTYLLIGKKVPVTQVIL